METRAYADDIKRAAESLALERPTIIDVAASAIDKPHSKAGRSAAQDGDIFEPSA